MRSRSEISGHDDDYLSEMTETGTFDVWAYHEYIFKYRDKTGPVYLTFCKPNTMEKNVSEAERGHQPMVENQVPKTTNQRRRWGTTIGVVLGLSYLAFRGPLSDYHPLSPDADIRKHHGHHHGHGHGHGHPNGRGCPIQPDPLHPKLTWNVTDEEKGVSVNHFSEAVVSPPSPSTRTRKGVFRVVSS